MPARRARTVAAAATVAAVVLTVGAAAPPAGAAPPAAAGRAGPTAVSLTLVTGDTVTLSGPAPATRVAVAPGPGRERVPFSVFRRASHVQVVPADAQILIDHGTVDPRLFDVSLLAGLHYGASPLIVGYAATGTGSAAAAVAAAGASVRRDLPALHAAAVRPGRTGSLWPQLVAHSGTAAAVPAPGIARIWLDGVERPALDQSVPQIGAPVAWAAGLDGTGISVAVLDTGVDAGHPDLAGKVIDQQNFTSEPDTGDRLGHGTHVASIIAGTGAASGGRYRGVAPGATLYNGKVCEVFGCPDSAILAGMQWAAADKHARVVNLSLGGTDFATMDPLEDAVNTLSAAYGTLFVIAAGNEGPGPYTVGSPGSADAALTVGAADKSDQLARFSSRGPRIGDDGLKPDILAPGVGIVAARASGTNIGDVVDQYYTRLSGTSMATPHVSGAAAILAEQHPQWSGAELKSALMGSAKPLPGLTAWDQGAGRVDVAREITQTILADPASLSLGRVAWPHTDDVPIVRTLTYHNDGAADVSLTVAGTLTGPDGQPGPAAMLTVSPAQLAVPAGGSASVTVTVDTGVPGPDGLYFGGVTATSGAARTVTPLGVDKEVESYDLRLNQMDRTGAPAADFFVQLTSVTTGRAYDYGPGDPIRLPRDRYDLATAILTPVGTGLSVTLLNQPILDLTSDTTLTLDARDAHALGLAVPDRLAGSVMIDAGYQRTLPGGATAGFDTLALTQDLTFARTLGAPVAPASSYTGYIVSQWTRTGPAGTVTDLYDLTSTRFARMLDGYRHTYQREEMSTIHNRFAVLQPGDAAVGQTYAWVPNATYAISAQLPATLPGRRTDRYSTGTGLHWDRLLLIGTPGPVFLSVNTALMSIIEAPPGGSERDDTWNTAVFGPSVTPIEDSLFGTYAARHGDEITFFVPLFGDGTGHGGDGRTDSASTDLYRSDGTLLAHSDSPGWIDAVVPPAADRYRLVTDVTRSGFTDLSTSVHVEWTFASARAVPDAPALQVFTVSAAPELDGGGARAGSMLTVPLTVTYEPGATVRPIATMTVAVSYDNGTTWRNAQVRHGAGGWVASIATPPGGSGYAWLRLVATDTAGDGLSETIGNAYRLTSAG